METGKQISALEAQMKTMLKGLTDTLKPLQVKADEFTKVKQPSEKRIVKMKGKYCSCTLVENKILFEFENPKDAKDVYNTTSRK